MFPPNEFQGIRIHLILPGGTGSYGESQRGNLINNASNDGIPE